KPSARDGACRHPSPPGSQAPEPVHVEAATAPGHRRTPQVYLLQTVRNTNRSSFFRNRSRVEVDKRVADIQPRSDFPAASVDPTDARKATVRCFGRSDRSVQRSGPSTG